jgi:hypothetical protein
MAAQVRADAGMRLLRAAVFSAVCVALSAVGHTMASGAGIPLWALLVGWAAICCLATPLAGRECSMPGITATLLCGQVALHLGFCLAQGRAPAAAAPSADGGGVHALSGMTGMSGMVDAASHSGQAMPMDLMLTPAMFVAHLAATFALGWILRGGEAALWRIVRASARRVDALAGLLATVLATARALTPAACPLDARPDVPWPGEADCGRVETFILRHSVMRRGPPALVTAA